jgi:AcrR family transcriptional regulator
MTAARSRIRLSTEVRRDQIVEAVLSLASDRGIASLGVADVAREVGVAPSAIYRHYPSKEAVLEATLDRVGRRVLDNVEGVRRECPGAIAALERLLALQIGLIRETRAIPLILFSEGFFREPPRRRRLLAVVTRYRRAVAALVREAQRQGDARADLDPDAAALLFVGLFQPAALLWHLSGGRFDIDSHARSAWEIFAAGVRAPARAPASRARRSPEEIPR